LKILKEIPHKFHIFAKIAGDVKKAAGRHEKYHCSLHFGLPKNAFFAIFFAKASEGQLTVPWRTSQSSIE
jgi:hypothetical protein